MAYLMLDVSEWQTRVNWEQVASKVSAVYIRALYGSAHVDQKLDSHSTGADKADLLIGYYHYVVPGITGREDDAQYQAEQFLKLVRGLPKELPCAIDLETTGNVGVYKLGSWFSDYIHALVAGGIGPWPVVYGPESILNLLSAGVQDVWLAWWPPQPPLPGARPPIPLGGRRLFAWQWTSQGKIPGIDGPVDLSWIYELPTHSKSFRAEQRIDSLLDRTLPAWWVGDRLLVDVQSLCEALDLEYSVVPSPEPEREHAVGVMVRPRG
jgi:hypothetical protein